MIKSKMFLKYLVLGVIITTTVALLGIVTSFWIRQSEMSSMNLGPLNMVQSLVDSVPAENRIESLKTLSKNPQLKMRFNLLLTDANGDVIFFENEGPTKKEALEYKALINNYEEESKSQEGSLLKLSGYPTQYLLIEHRHLDGLQYIPQAKPRFLKIFFILAVTIAFGVFATLFFIFYSFRKDAQVAEQVISQLRQGNLKARFPIKKMDEVGLVMVKFNQMASEIETLIESLRKAENSRKSLLQELAHDLRTPIASLKNLLETSSEKREQLSEEQEAELLNLSITEVEYIEHLVEDLLFLGQVNEPRYKRESEKVSLPLLMCEELENLGERHQEINITENYSDRVSEFNGDPQLLKRLFRNALENSFSFAKNDLSVSITEQPDQITISIGDDGPGFSSDSLSSFGERKFSRAIQPDRKHHISIGLGSVIMKSVAESYRGHITAANRTDSLGNIEGATVTITLSKK